MRGHRVRVCTTLLPDGLPRLRRPIAGRLDKFEIPVRVGLTSIVWSPDNNLVTAAFKLKRKELADFYREDLRRLYN